MRVREGVREGEGVGRGVNEARGARATYLLRREPLLTVFSQLLRAERNLREETHHDSIT